MPAVNTRQDRILRLSLATEISRESKVNSVRPGCSLEQPGTIIGGKNREL
jgi:hypothetical protein